MALPENIQTIVGIIGHGPTMELVRAFGGRPPFRFPTSRTSANWEALVEIIGERLAEKLATKFGGSQMYIALCAESIRLDRNSRMIDRYEALIAEGHSGRGAVFIITGEFAPISHRQVETIVNGPRPSQAPEMTTQGQLF